ncbi:DUF3363 domain-containing protein [Bradyrhizobium sp. CCGB12]|uniref:relaxase/mobilization nuclease domain-containing protein n=1 Tax=Bradyrhizobium sp. CCGB12 TaxID=2949632 RepID=UPI0020B3322B|nr:DUF3363 domain-containing protein [Bradyrhizobium sp. CCGB12]MCP3387728.1 DUF3363 domain-containing protein [Bradyrhizobium sp. CCGB12]
MTSRDDDLRIRPGRIHHGNRGAKRPKSFVGEVMRSAKRAGHVGNRFRSGQAHSRSHFGRGRRAAVSIRLRSNARRVVTKARVVRHKGSRFRSAPLPKHLAYLKRDGVTRDGEDARMFDRTCDAADERAFAARCEEDRHHFRFIVSPEDGAALGELKTFTRELMRDVEKDLGTGLEWIAVDHWNTDNPHVHILVRGRADNGQDLVISREYISRGLRDRAAERITLELGPRSEHEIRASLGREVDAERWTSLDRALRDISDANGGVADLRPSDDIEDPELRTLLLGRAAKLERLGLAEPAGPVCWTLKPGLDQTLRQLGMRGDIIKTMHQALVGAGREPDISTFALHGEEPADSVLGRLVKRGLDDELKGSAYAIIVGVDGRTHHLRFADIEMTGDGPVGAIVEPPRCMRAKLEVTVEREFDCVSDRNERCFPHPRRAAAVRIGWEAFSSAPTSPSGLFTRKDGQPYPRRHANANGAQASEDLTPGRRRHPDLGQGEHCMIASNCGGEGECCRDHDAQSQGPTDGDGHLTKHKR